MPHETNLIATVVAGFVLAFAFGFVAKRLRISPIVGYLLAGIAVGPHTPGFVSDAWLSLELAEIGVILLMFGVGLHFSIGDLLAMRRIALPGAVAQIGVATAIGAAVAVYWGWSLGAGLVFGLALSVASTVVLIRAIEDRDLLRTVNGRIAVGWLVVEDFAMVIAIVLLPPLTRASSGAADGVDSMSLAIALAWTVGKAAVFIALALIIGKRAVPWLLAQVARAGSRELFTLFVLATALGIAYASSTLFSVSFALGAFFAGVILSGSDLSYRASAEMLPLQDAFAVLFFVSVGMLFNFWIVISQPLSLIVVVLIILLGKSIAAFSIVLAFRYPIGVALTVSSSLAQIGEFSFILAGLGTVLGVLQPEGRDLILVGALLSIALNPLAFSIVAPVERWLHGRQRLMRWIGGETNRLRQVEGDATADLRDHAVTSAMAVSAASSATRWKPRACPSSSSSAIADSSMIW